MKTIVDSIHQHTWGASKAALATAMALLTVAAASAQSVPADSAAPAAASAAGQPAEAAAEAAAGGDIVVTGSRVARAGFANPTPTTIVNADAIAQRGQTNATDILNDLPAFRGSFGPTTAGPALRGALATADLRGLGAVRTLVLVNGLRGVPTTTTGLTDMNLIPTLSIDRVDVVTGGVSAGYGSDAVAGIVNFVLRKEADGIRGDVMKGISRYGDNSEFRIGLEVGTRFADDRGRIILSGEYVDNNGVGDSYERPWGRESHGVYQNGAANGLPRRLILPEVWVSNFTRGGIITGGTNLSPANLATLRTMAFGPNGNPYTFQFGSLTNATQTAGAVVGTNPGAFAFPQNLAMLIPIERFATYGRVGYDIADDVEFYVAGQLAGYNSRSVTFPQTHNVTVQADNAFLPASIRALMSPNSTITVGRLTEDNIGLPVTFARNRTYNGIVGLEGKFGDWSWDVAAQFGRNEFKQRSTNRIIAQRMNWATDAIVSNGQIVCRQVALNNPAAQGCVPFNIFGQGSPSAAAEAWVRGTGTVNLVTRQTQVAANLRGEPFSTWAGPVSVAVGGEYRKTSADQTVDADSLNNRFLSGPINLKPLDGSYNVKEVYLEAVVPLASDMTFAKSLELNGAVRYTDYSTSGTVTTWKVGGTYEPFTGLRFRATRSRDIRAPNIAEIFTLRQTGNPNTLTNPFTNGPAGIVPLVTSGNADLQPEIAKSLTLGAVVQPVQIPGLSLSVDYYNIKLKDAIAQVPAQQILNQCAAGNAQLCDLVDLSPTNQILEIRSPFINIASLKFRGIDIEAAYRIPMNFGTLNLGVMATRTLDAIIDDGVTGPIDRAGEVGTAGGIGKPKWTLTHTVNLELDRWRVGMQGRFLSSGKYDNTFAEGVAGVPGPGGFTINDNKIPSVYYVNLNTSVDVIDEGKRKLQFYGVINNLFDKAPPIAPQGGGVTNPVLYDVIGQTFKFGVRFSY